jgi:Polymer-forming cytoskeletal
MMKTPVGPRPILRRALFATAIVVLVAWVATALGSLPLGCGLAPGPVGAVVHAVASNVATAVAQEVQETQKNEDLPEPPEPPEPPKITIGKSGNITRIGSDIEIGPDQVVEGDVVAVGGDVKIYGRVEGDVAAMGGDVHLMASADIEGDVVCMGGRLIEEDGAKVGGQRVSGLGRGRRGTVIREGWRDEEHRENKLASSLAGLLLMAGAAWGFASLGPGRTREVMTTLRRETVMSFGIGTLVMALLIPSIVALALVVALLCITIIGIPVALAAMLGYCLFLVLIWVWGYVAAAAVLGDGILSRRAANAPVGMAPTPPTLVNAALLGVLIINGSSFLGALLKETGGFLHGFGTLIRVLAILAGILLTVAGSGAWLRTEFRAGTIARWWRGNQWGRRSDASPPPPPPPAPVTPPPPPPMPSPASSFMPPGMSSGSGGTTEPPSMPTS